MQQLIPAAGGAGLHLKRGARLRILDPQGGQSGDLVAFSQDGHQRLSNGRTFDYGGKIYLSKGDTLWSDRSEPMLTIVADTCGRHDTLGGACAQESNMVRYAIEKRHMHACRNSFLKAVTEWDHGMTKRDITANINFFMNVDVGADGLLMFAPPRSRPGDSFVVRAEMDLAVAVSACPASTCNGGAPPRPLAFEILRD